MFISVLRHQIQKRDGTEIWVQKLKLFSSYEMTTWDGSAEYPILSFSSAFGVTEDKKKYTNNKRCYQMFSMELQNRQEWLREKSTTGKHPKSKNKCIERNFTNAFPSKIKQHPMWAHWENSWRHEKTRSTRPWRNSVSVWPVLPCVKNKRISGISRQVTTQLFGRILF